MKTALFKLSSILTLILLWYLIYLLIDQPLLIPSLTDVFSSLFAIISSADIFVLIMSLNRLIVSFFSAALLGIIIGFMSAKSRAFEWYQRPFITIMKTIPVLSIIVILFIIFGSHFSPYIITFLIIFPLFYQSSYDGIKHIDPDLIDVLKLNEGRFKESFKYVYLPCLQHDLMITVFQALGLGLKVLVMAEYLMQVPHSIGQSIYEARIQLNYRDVYAWTILLIAMAFLLEMCVRYIKNKHLT